MGSPAIITKADCYLIQQLSYYAWGNRRDSLEWESLSSNTTLPESLIDRWFTFHEHLYPFTLINMNGRVYDPLVRRFLSPDPFVQDISNSQSHNRYSYCWYNPLRYTDPTGEFVLIDDIIAGAVGGLINLGVNAIQGNLSGHGFWGGVGRGFAAFGAGAVGGVGALYPEFGGLAWGGATVGATNAWLGGATSAKDIAIGAGVGAIAGVAGGAAGQWAVNSADPLLSSISSPVLRGDATYVGGFTGGLIMTGDLGAGIVLDYMVYGLVQALEVLSELEQVINMLLIIR